MNVSIEKLLQPQTSYSRTGKMVEAFTPAKITVLGHDKKPGLDFTKMLAANELGSEEQQSACLCSSPRLHPSVLMKAEYVSRYEKEAAFKDSMRNVLAQPYVAPAAQPRCQETAHTTHSSPEPQRKPHSHGSAAFLAVSRAQLDKDRRGGIPPVGHYRPRFEVLEESAPRVKIAKHTHHPRQRVHPTPADTSATDISASASAATPQGDHSPNGTDGAPRSPQQVSAPALGQRCQAATAVSSSSPSWPFASKSAGHVLQTQKSWSVEPDPNRRCNYAVVEQFTPAKQRGICMASAVGRRGDSTSVQLKDVIYNSTGNPFRGNTPTPSFTRTTGRDSPERLPRTSAEVPRLRSRTGDPNDALDATKFARQPVLVDLRRSSLKHASRKPPPVPPPEGYDCNSPPRVQSPDFSKYRGHPKPTPKTHEVVYDVSFAAVDKHEPSAHITEPLFGTNRSAERCASELDLNPKVEALSLHPHVTRNISFDGYVSREGRENCGRSANVKLQYDAQQKFYDVPLQSRVPGDPHISTQVSREKRMELLSPPRCRTDEMYVVSADALLPSLHKGMVEIDKMLDREKRSHSSIR